MMTVEMKPLPNDLIDALLANYTKPDDLIGQNGLLKQLTKALVERALQAEMTTTWATARTSWSSTSG
jgi:putative transposase